MSSKKPLATDHASARAACPVCGEVSYSRSGIHPQCAQKQADLKRLKRPRKSLKTKAESSQRSQSSEPKAWHKWCPKCKKQVHVRKTACPCGHSFKR